MRQLFIILLLAFPLSGFGQLITSGAMSPSSLVQNVLLGTGVTVSNINYSGSPGAIGSFTANNTNLGITSGIVMTTGTISNTGDGPQGPNNDPGSGIDNNTVGYPPLASLIGGTTYNASVLEFDFVPYADSVKFRYVFGSEEYPEYVGTQFNDVFAFFISGPGISGLQNIAKLPSGQAVAINNVNNGQTNSGPCMNCAYYVYNGNGSNAPYNSSNNFIQYDGFTTVLTASSQVQCGQTYHLVIAIADVGDGILDSGIFLEANSLSSNTPVDISYAVTPQLFSNPDIMAEGCASTTVTLERGPNGLSAPLTIPVNVSGSATEGVDYTNIPNSVTFPAGVSQIQFSLDAFQDGIAEGQESVTLTFPITDPCGNVNPIIINLFIQDTEPVDVTIEGGSMICPGDLVTLTANPSGGAPPYTYSWSTGESTQSINVTPGSTTTYSVSVTDACLGQTATDDFEVVVPVLPPLTLSTTPNITEICPYIPATLEATPAGGSGNYTYQWSSNSNPNLGTSSSISVSPASTTTYTVVVTDNCGNQVSSNILYTITSPPLTLIMSPAVEICPGDSAFISVTASGGYGNFYYYWFHSGETTPGVWVHPGVTTVYTVSVADECQTFTVEGSTQVIVIKPTADFTTTSTVFFNNLPITFLNESQNAVTYEWEFGDGNTSTDINPSNTYLDPGMYYITLVATDDKGCTDTITKPIGIEEEWYIYVPNTFTPDGDRHNNDFRASTVGISQLSINIFDRWGEVIFTSDDLNFVWDGTYQDLYVPDGTYTWKIEFMTNSGRNRTITGHVNVLR